jgi:hypothetical protein
LAKRRPVPKIVRTMAPSAINAPAKPPALPAPTPPKYRHGGRTLAERRAAKLGAMRGQGMSRLVRLGQVALPVAVGAVGAGRLLGDYRENMIRSALLDIQKGQDALRQREMMRQAQAASYEDAIGRNLRSLQQSAPDLYASVAAGRKLPQGGVVIGGAPRQDLLNELGRAMSDGRFSR